MLSNCRLWRFSRTAVQASIPQEVLPHAAWLALTPLFTCLPYLVALRASVKHSIPSEAKNLSKYAAAHSAFHVNSHEKIENHGDMLPLDTGRTSGRRRYIRTSNVCNQSRHSSGRR